MLIELRPDKKLLDSNFNGYKLSLDPIPVYQQHVHEGVDTVVQSEDQYSFIHAKVFTLHNHLFNDPFHENTVYFIDKIWKIYRGAINPQTGRVETLEEVWSIPDQNKRKSGHFNSTIIFPSASLAVVGDGCGCLHIVSRGGNTPLWQLEQSIEVEDCCQGCVLMTVRLNADEALHCVLMSLATISVGTEPDTTQPSEAYNKPKPPSGNSVLHWLTFVRDPAGLWTEACRRRLEGAGSVDYLALEPSCAAIYIVTNATFKFTTDSANPLSSSPPLEVEQMDTEEPEPLYTWQQTEDELTVVLRLEAGVSKSDVQVSVKERELVVQSKGETVFARALNHYVDPDLTTWAIQSERLEITMWKRDPGLMWPELVQGDVKGCQVMDPAVVGEVHSRLSHLCSDTQVQERGEEYAPTFNLDQLEECDLAPDDRCSLVRLDAVSHTISHQISLTGHQWLMSVPVEEAEGTGLGLCVRHDVDGCVWHLNPPPSSTSSEWPCQHIGTFCALGYVAASKQQKKFIVAAPDLSYAAICEASCHVFLYRKASLVNGELRNRKTATKVALVAKQQLINLESQSPILGAYASNSYLFVLTTETLYTFCVQ